MEHKDTKAQRHKGLRTEVEILCVFVSLSSSAGFHRSTFGRLPKKELFLKIN